MNRKDISTTLQERFGDPIGSYAGNAPVGVRDEEDCEVCEKCGMMPVEGCCGCVEESEDAKPCDECGMLEVEGNCGCKHMDEAKRKGPTKKTAQVREFLFLHRVSWNCRIVQQLLHLRPYPISWVIK